MSNTIYSCTKKEQISWGVRKISILETSNILEFLIISNIKRQLHKFRETGLWTIRSHKDINESSFIDISNRGWDNVLTISYTYYNNNLTYSHPIECPALLRGHVSPELASMDWTIHLNICMHWSLFCHWKTLSCCILQWKIITQWFKICKLI